MTKSALLAAIGEAYDELGLDEALEDMSGNVARDARESGTSEDDVLGALARRALLLGVAEVFWRAQLGRLLNRQEVQEILGVRTRQAVSELVRHGRILALPREGGGYAFPAAQFDLSRGRIWPQIPAVLALFSEADVSPLTTASWLTSPEPDLDDETPAAAFASGRGEEVLEAARRQSAALAR